jgi:xanthine dehydrogenase/oxidase
MAGQLCRCTGYRPILDCVRELAGAGGGDIEDLADWVCPARQGGVVRRGGDWVAPSTVRQVLETLAGLPAGRSYRLVAGATGQGVYPAEEWPAQLYIQLSGVAELGEVGPVAAPLAIGAAVTLADVITTLRGAAEAMPGQFGYCEQVAGHLEQVASPAIRARGSLGGNLLLRHRHPAFPSDPLVLLEAVGAKLEVAWLEAGELHTATLLPSAWLAEPMDQRLLPALPATSRLFSYRVRDCRLAM